VQGFDDVIENHYRQCDAMVGRLMERADGDTLVIVLSDHGFTSFQRGVHLNTWLLRHGFLALTSGVEPGDSAGDLLKHVDWSRTSAYALGLGGIYLNLAGREAGGFVSSAEAERVKDAIAGQLTGLVDEERQQVAVRGVTARESVYSGPCVGDAPDLVVRFNRGYRSSWATGLGGVPAAVFEDNVKRWGGDHVVDPSLVPGVLFMNRPFQRDGARLVDLAPTILAALGVASTDRLEGTSLLP
jgi:predicted AlkP superfamily phosphohydrolase/phosphomutase